MNLSKYRLAKMISAIFLTLVLAGCGTLAEGFALKPVQKDIGTVGIDWPQFNLDAQHTGNNPNEVVVDTQSITALRQLFQIYLPDKVYQGPVYLRNVKTSKGILDLLFVTMSSGSILAIDASNGNFIWERKLGVDQCIIDQATQNCYTASVPAIDPNHQFVYGYGIDGKVHKLQVTDGTEVTGNGWPETITTNNSRETSNSALTTVTTQDGKNYLYITVTGYPEGKGNYSGRLVVIDLATGAQQVFNPACSNIVSNQQANCPNFGSGIMQPAGVVYSPDTNRVYVSTGQGKYDPANFAWGNSILALNPDGSSSNGKPLDSYTPSGNGQQNPMDNGQSSAAFAILPASSKLNTPALGLQVGTDGLLRLVDLTNLSGKGGPGNIGGEIGKPVQLPQDSPTLGQPAVMVNPSDQSVWVFIANSQGLSAFELENNGTPTLVNKWFLYQGGTSPIIASGTLYFSGSGIVRAMDPLTGKVLWTDTSVGQVKMETPILVNGILYVLDWDNHLTAYSLNGELP